MTGSAASQRPAASRRKAGLPVRAVDVGLVHRIAEHGKRFLIVAQLHLDQFAIGIVDLLCLFRQRANFLPNSQTFRAVSFQPCMDGFGGKCGDIFLHQAAAGLGKLIKADGLSGFLFRKLKQPVGIIFYQQALFLLQQANEFLQCALLGSQRAEQLGGVVLIQSRTRFYLGQALPPIRSRTVAIRRSATTEVFTWKRPSLIACLISATLAAFTTGEFAMLFSMFCTCAAVEPSETLVPAGCLVAEACPDLSLLLARATLSPVELAGSVLPGLSIFTVILSIWRFLKLRRQLPYRQEF